MKNKFDDIKQLNTTELCKMISEIAYLYIHPKTHMPTEVPASHYEKYFIGQRESKESKTVNAQQLDSVYRAIEEINIAHPQLVHKALFLMEMGINPRMMNIREKLALEATFQSMYESQLKFDHQLFSKDIEKRFEQIIQDQGFLTSVNDTIFLLGNIDNETSPIMFIQDEDVLN